MPRTTQALVEGVLRSGRNGSDYDGATDLGPYITVANILTTRCETDAVAQGVTWPSADKTVLETWLAAWAYCNADKTYTQKQTGKAMGIYAGRTGKKFESNFYGQTALTLDPTGVLENLNSGMMVDAFWGGLNTQDQTDWDARNLTPSSGV